MGDKFIFIVTILGFLWICYGCLVWASAYIDSGKGRDFLGAAGMLIAAFVYVGIWMEIYT